MAVSPRAHALVSTVKASRHHAGFPHCTNTEQGSLPHSNIRGPPWALAAVSPCPPAPHTHLKEAGLISPQHTTGLPRRPPAKDVPASPSSGPHPPQPAVQLPKYLTPQSGQPNGGRSPSLRRRDTLQEYLHRYCRFEPIGPTCIVRT